MTIVTFLFISCAGESNNQDMSYESNNQDMVYKLNLPELKLNPIYMPKPKSNSTIYYAYDVSQLTKNNPWSETDIIEMLPVFENKIYYNKEGNIIGKRMTTDEGIKKAEEFASIASVTIDSINMESFDVDLIDMIKYIQADCEYMTIHIGEDGVNSVIFKHGELLQENIKFGFFNANEYDTITALYYLSSKYAYFFDIEDLVPAVRSVYTNDGKVVFNPLTYKKGGNLIENILNYNFNMLLFMPSIENNKLQSIIHYQTDLSQKIGDYPIIDIHQAKNLLLQGNFISTNTFETLLPNEYNIAGIELTYKFNGDYTCTNINILIPYYCFYIEVPLEMLDETQIPIVDGLKAYIQFFVPAVENKYIDVIA